MVVIFGLKQRRMATKSSAFCGEKQQHHTVSPDETFSFAKVKQAFVFCPQTVINKGAMCSVGVGFFAYFIESISHKFETEDKNSNKATGQSSSKMKRFDRKSGRKQLYGASFENKIRPSKRNFDLFLRCNSRTEFTAVTSEIRRKVEAIKYE